MKSAELRPDRAFLVLREWGALLSIDPGSEFSWLRSVVLLAEPE